MVVIRGRTVLRKATGDKALVGVQVRISGIRREPPSAYLPTSFADPNLVFITPPLFFDRSAKQGRLHRYNLKILKDPGRTLLENVEPGSKLIYASRWQGLSPGDLVAIDALDPERVEFHAIETVPSGSQAQSGRLGLTIPLQRAHGNGARLQKVNSPNKLGTMQHLKEDARVGESCIFLHQLKNLKTAHHVAITASSKNPSEYHSMQIYEAESNEQGYYSLPPISRIALLQIQAEQTPQTLTAPSPSGSNTITVSNVDTLSRGQKLRVGPAGGKMETAEVKKVTQQTRIVELMANLSSVKNVGDLVISFLPDTDFSPDYTVRENQLDFVFG
jgi:hypothetical protein